MIAAAAPSPVEVLKPPVHYSPRARVRGGFPCVIFFCDCCASIWAVLWYTTGTHGAAELNGRCWHTACETRIPRGIVVHRSPG